ncbi:MAG: tRNA pseudouridine synthase A [Verrucomicrobiales bacterium]|nr:tRNA pseudouridine synthase A [Verrucomicrobiales bacterium]
MDTDPTPPRLRLTLAYDGTPWRGWQTLSGGGAVQDALDAALAKVADGPVRSQGSGRTDAGVHALGQVAHAIVPHPHRLPPEAWVRALNAHLPPTIRVLHASLQHGFHARFDAIGKVYRYRIWRSDILHPLEVNRAWHVYGPLDADLLRRGASLLEGRHDFSRLSANRAGSTALPATPDPLHAVRTLHRVTLHTDPAQPLWELEFEGDGFLYKMVRMLVGSLVHIARGRAPLAWLEDLLQHPQDGIKSNQSAPAAGLYLVRVLYADEPHPRSADPQPAGSKRAGPDASSPAQGV